MSKPAAATVPSCRLHSGAFRGVLAILALLPAAVLAANPDPTLRRSDQLDVRRLGKVSEDERSVLRIEWRAGLAGAEETRGVDEMLVKLRRLETGISEVSRLVRNMPVQKPGVAATAPVAAEAPDTDGYGLRLIVANIAALALVALWWFRRRKSATRPEADPASAPKKLSPAPAPSVRTALTMTPTAEASRATPSAVAQELVVVTEAKPGGEAPGSQPGRAGEAYMAAPAPGPLATVQPVATAAATPPQAKPSGSLPARQAMVIDFSLEEADPETVARENAKLQAPRAPTSPKAPEPPPKADVEPTLQLAEIMLSMGLEQGAAQALGEYIEANPRLAVYHWLKLLGIYRSRGLQKEFAETAEKLRNHFNIQAEEWGKPATGEAPMLEKFSRVSEHVQKIWSQPEECISYLRHLLEDNREGARAGFPQSVAEEILFLVEILKDGKA